jgi:hypothetical protein
MITNQSLGLIDILSTLVVPYVAWRWGVLFRRFPTGVDARRCPLFEQGLCDVVVPELTPLSARRGVSCHVAVRAYGKDVADGQAVPAAATR